MLRVDGADHPINGDARCEAQSRGSCLCGARGEPASGVQGAGRRSHQRALPQHPLRRCKSAGGHEGRGGRAPPLRLSADPHHAQASGYRHEPEEAAPAVSGGEAPSPPAWRSQAGDRHEASHPGAGSDQRPLEPRFRVRRLHGRSALPGAGRGGRLQPGMPGAGCRHLAFGPAGDARARRAARHSGQACDHRFRQRHGTDFDGSSQMVPADWCRMALHRSRQADAERLRRELHVWTAPALQGCYEAGARRGSGAFMYAAYECGPSHDRWP